MIMTEFVLLNPMNDLRRLARRGNVVEPAPRSGSVVAQFQDPRSQRIAPAEVVEQPAVELRRLQSILDFGHTFGRGGISAHWSRQDGENHRGRQGEESSALHGGGETTPVASSRARNARGG